MDGDDRQETNSRRAFLSKDVAWRSYDFKDDEDSPLQTEYILFARACEDQCKIEIRLPISASDTNALFESYKNVLLDGSYLQTSSSERISDDESPGDKTWLVIAGTWPQTDYHKVTERLAMLKAGGIAARIIKTRDYPNLTPNLFAVVLALIRRMERRRSCE
jgi:hypothetical protein